MRRTLCLPIALFLFACGPSSVGFDGGETLDGGADSPAPSFQLEDAHFDAPAPTEAGSCDPPDMLVILDRSESMSVNVGTQGTRINLAMAAINTITQPPTDSALRFGLQTLPAIGGAECSTQLVVPMALDTSSSITHALGTMSPQLDYGTPIGGALTSALGTFAKNKVGTRKQYVLLLTDGGECCSCNTNDYDIGVAQQLYAAGVETFVVGFGGDDDPVLLNDSRVRRPHGVEFQRQLHVHVGRLPREHVDQREHDAALLQSRRRRRAEEGARLDRQPDVLRMRGLAELTKENP